MSALARLQLAKWLSRTSLVGVIALAGCVSSAEVQAIRADQKKILERLDALQSDQRETGKRLASIEELLAPLRQGPRPDPAEDDEEAEAKKEAATVYAVPVADSPVLGPAEAPVTIVMFSDFQCPYCSRGDATLMALREAYDGKLRIVFKNSPLPFHPYARPAAVAAVCAAAQGKFWPMHDRLFANQQALDDEALARYAKGAGVNLKKWKTCLDGDTPGEVLARDQKLAESLGVSGTPTFFINGHKLVGARPIDQFRQLIDAALAEFQASGIPAKDYYEQAVIEKGKR